MKPRVFISSTYYDLKYVRENMLRFVEDKYGYEAILFERGNVPYTYNNSMSQSCYAEVERCNMMILIVGGKYGSIEPDDSEKIISITRKEFKTADNKNIPVFIFIDKNVYLEYQIYTSNSSESYNPVFVDNIKVFEFINELKDKPIKTFEKMDDIEEYLAEQWSGWFYDYLENMGNSSYDNINRKLSDTFDSIEKLRTIINEMLTFTLKEEQRNKVYEEELKTDIRIYAANVVDNIIFDENILITKNNSIQFGDLFFETFYNESIINNFNSPNVNKFDYFEELIKNFNKKLQEDCEGIRVKTIDFAYVFQRKEKVINLLLDNKDNVKYYKECISKELEELYL